MRRPPGPAERGGRRSVARPHGSTVALGLLGLLAVAAGGLAVRAAQRDITLGAAAWALVGVGLVLVLLLASALEQATRRRDLVLGLATDLSERSASLDSSTRAEQTALAALHNSEDHFRRLFESNPEPMWVHDVADLRFLAVNDAAVAEYGYSREQFLAMSLADIKQGAEMTDVEASITEHTPRDRSGPWTHVRSDQSTLVVEVTSHAMKFNDVDARLVIAHDVTDREQFRLQIAQAQRLEGLGQLAGGVAHDFNNLLSVILNYAEFVEEKVSAAEQLDEHWAQAKNDVQQIQRAAVSAVQLTRQLLTFARRGAVTAQVLSLNTIVSDVEHLLGRTLGEHMTLSTNLDPELWAIKADSGQIEQILVNLAVNSRDAMPGGGALVIDTENVIVDQDYADSRVGLHPGRYVRLRVSDTGAGMTKEVQTRAFEPFFTTKPAGQGTGLGLATVFGIIGQIGGDLQIYSEPGIGTTVTALIPTVDAAPVDTPPPPPVPVAGHGESILLVAHAASDRAMAQRILIRSGYQVVAVDSPLQAIVIAVDQNRRIDLLVTDVVMPQMLGSEVAKRVTRLRRGLPVLFMSGYAEQVISHKGNLDRGASLLEKPFGEATLLAKIREVMDNAGQASPEQPVAETAGTSA